MRGNSHVRFLGEEAAAMSLPYPTRLDGIGENERLRPEESPPFSPRPCHSSRFT